MGSAQKPKGILPDSHLKTLIREHAIDAAPAITDSQIQPASVDLRLGTKAYRLISSFLPERSGTSEHLNVLDLYQSELVMYDMDLTQGAILEKRARLSGAVIGTRRVAPGRPRAGQP